LSCLLLLLVLQASSLSAAVLTGRPRRHSVDLSELGSPMLAQTSPTRRASLPNLRSSPRTRVMQGTFPLSPAAAAAASSLSPASTTSSRRSSTQQDDDEEELASELERAMQQTMQVT